MREVSIWLDAHCSRGDKGVFKSVAELADACVSDEVYSVGSGKALVDLAPLVRKSKSTGDFELIDHLVIAGHGGSTWLLDDEHGVTTGKPRHRGQVSVPEFVDAWSPILSKKPLISLAACMCSRSPRWFLRWRWQTVGSDWGRRAYLPGGQASISARIRDELWWRGHYADVRGHRAAGHASALALLAHHCDDAAGACEPLFALALPGVAPTLVVRRRWVRLVTGQLAARWLLGDDSVVEEIRNRWDN